MNMHLEYERSHAVCWRRLAHGFAQNFQVTLLVSCKSSKVLDLVDEIGHVYDAGNRQKSVEDVYEIKSLRNLNSWSDFVPNEVDKFFGVVVAQFLNEPLHRCMRQLDI